MITILFNVPTGLWSVLLPSGEPLAFRRAADGTPIPDLFSSSQRALREAHGSLRDNACATPHVVVNAQESTVFGVPSIPHQLAAK